ncbi:MAG: virulence factor TspB C-terminal domain-related protein [Pseudomonadota bacterium]
MKIIIARLMLPLFTLFTIMTPYRVVQAVVIPFPAVPLAVEAVTQAGAVVAMSNPLALGTVLALGVIAYFVLRDSSKSSDLAKIPAGKAAGNAIAAPTAPGSTSQIPGARKWFVNTGCLGGVTHTGFSTGAAAFTDYVQTINTVSACTGNGAYKYSVCDAEQSTVTYSYNGGPQVACHSPTGVFFSQEPTTCPSGYAMSGNSCTLTNAYQANPNASVDFNRSGETFGQPAGAPTKKGGIAPLTTTTSTSNDTIYQSGKDANGNPMAVSLQATAAGTTLNVQTQKTDANGNSYVSNNAYNFDPAGVPLGTTQNATQQTLALDPNTGQLQAAPAPANTASPATSQSPAPAASPTDCQLFPDASGCQPLGDIPDNELQQKNIPISITPVSIGGAGVCPQPRIFHAGGHNYTLSYQMICDFASGVRPVILALAWLFAGMTLIGGMRSNG